MFIIQGVFRNIKSKLNISCEKKSIVERNFCIKGHNNNKIKKHNNRKYSKKQIPKALREQVWIENFGNKFEHKCYISWCTNMITCFNFDCGHNIPESKGGKTNISNLKPICRNCNLSMGNKYTIEEWDNKYKSDKDKKILPRTIYRKIYKNISNISGYFI